MTGFWAADPIGEEHDAIREDGTPFPGLEHPAMVALRTGQQVRGVVMGVLNPKAGAYRWISVHAVPVCHPGESRPAEVYTVFDDITERKRAEETIQESETKYRNLFGHMTEEVHFWKLVRDENGQIKTWSLVDANPPSLMTWGRTLEEVRGKTTDEIFGPGATEHYLPVIQKIMTEGVPYTFEDYFPNLDKHFRFTSVPLGEHFITTGADITSIKKAELKLRESEERLRLLGDNLPDSAVYQYAHETDGSVRFLYFSAGVERLNGVSVEDVRREAGTLHRQSPPEYIERLVEAEARSKRDLTDFDMEIPMRRPDGESALDAIALAPAPPARRAHDLGRGADRCDWRKAAEDALRKSEQEFRALAEAVPQIVWATRPDGWNIYFNQQWMDYTGLTLDESYGHGWITPFHPDDKQAPGMPGSARRNTTKPTCWNAVCGAPMASIAGG